MSGFPRGIGWRAFLPVVSRLAALLSASLNRRRVRAVIDPDRGPHWLHRDIEPGSGRLTRQAMRRPPNWPDPAG